MINMKLYLMTQSDNNDYDTYDSVIVSAESEDDAKNIHPSEFATHVEGNNWMGTYADKTSGTYLLTYHGWIDYSKIDNIEIEYLGDTDKKRGVILASFNAG